MVFSSNSGKFVFRSLEVVITTSGVFKSRWAKHDGNVAALQKQQDFLNSTTKWWLKKMHIRCVFALCFYSISEDSLNGTIISSVIVQYYHILYMQLLL